MMAVTVRQISDARDARAYLAGALHGDAWCSALTIGLRVKDEDFAREFARALNIASAGTLAPKRDERGYWLVRTSNKTGKFDYLKTSEPHTHREQGFWLRGLFDSEGNAQLHLGKRGGNCYSRRVSIYSTDIATLQKADGILGALNMRGIIRPTKNSVGHKGTKTVYELSLRGGEGNYKRFAASVGSSIARKQSALERIAGSYHPDPAEAARHAQQKGAEAKKRKTLDVTLPRVVEGVRELIKQGIKPTQRNCHSIPGFHSIQRYVPQAELVRLAGGA